MSVARTERYVEELQAGRQRPEGRVNVGQFLNHLSLSLQKIQLSGVAAISKRLETDREIVVTITIPKDEPAKTVK